MATEVGKEMTRAKKAEELASRVHIPAERERNITRRDGFSYELAKMTWKAGGPKIGLGVKHYQNRVLVSKTEAGSMSAECFKMGDHIVDIDGQPVTDRDVACAIIIEGLQAKGEISMVIERPKTMEAKLWTVKALTVQAAQPPSVQMNSDVRDIGKEYVPWTHFETQMRRMSNEVEATHRQLRVSEQRYAKLELFVRRMVDSLDFRFGGEFSELWDTWMHMRNGTVNEQESARAPTAVSPSLSILHEEGDETLSSISQGDQSTKDSVGEPTTAASLSSSSTSLLQPPVPCHTSTPKEEDGYETAAAANSELKDEASKLESGGDGSIPPPPPPSALVVGGTMTPLESEGLSPDATTHGDGLPPSSMTASDQSDGREATTRVDSEGAHERPALSDGGESTRTRNGTSSTEKEDDGNETTMKNLDEQLEAAAAAAAATLQHSLPATVHPTDKNTTTTTTVEELSLRVSALEHELRLAMSLIKEMRGCDLTTRTKFKRDRTADA